jgi:hypothetical protein
MPGAVGESRVRRLLPVPVYRDEHRDSGQGVGRSTALPQRSPLSRSPRTPGATTVFFRCVLADDAFSPTRFSVAREPRGQAGDGRSAVALRAARSRHRSRGDALPVRLDAALLRPAVRHLLVGDDRVGSRRQPALLYPPTSVACRLAQVEADPPHVRLVSTIRIYAMVKRPPQLARARSGKSARVGLVPGG